MSKTKPERLYWYQPDLDESGDSGDPDFLNVILTDKEDPQTNLISSQTDHSTWHRPVIDIDHDLIKLVPSSTPHHFHMYIDALFTWPQLEKLLDVLVEVGLVEPGYRDASVARRSTFVRPSWVKKKTIENKDE